jgi:hypothetical protein
MPEIHINYLAVLLCGVTYMVIGMAWYGPLFGKQWKALMGFNNQSMKQMKMTAMQAMVSGLISALIMAFVLAHDAYVWGQFYGDSISQLMFALQLAFWIWLGYVATTQAGSVLWEGRPWKLFFINAGNTLVAFVAMALILTFVK